MIPIRSCGLREIITPMPPSALLSIGSPETARIPNCSPDGAAREYTLRTQSSCASEVRRRSTRLVGVIRNSDGLMLQG